MPVKRPERTSQVQGVQHLARALGTLPQRAALRSKETDAMIDGAGHKRFWAGVLSTLLARPEQLTATLRSTGGGAIENELRSARLAMTLRRYELSA